MRIAPHRLLDYVEDAEDRARTSSSELILVSRQVVAFLGAQRRAAVSTIDAIRDAALGVTLGNCSQPIHDLQVLEHLAQRAVDAGLIDGLHPSIQQKLSQARPAPPPSAPGEGDRETTTDGRAIWAGGSTDALTERMRQWLHRTSPWADAPYEGGFEQLRQDARGLLLLHGVTP